MPRQAPTARLTVPVTAADHVLGPPAAPVTLVEYGDFECPFCGQAHGVVRALREQLGRQLRFVFRHFPLTTVHPHAQHAAEAAEAAGAEGKFWEMHDVLFEHQDALEDSDLVRYAAALGLDQTRFILELAGHVHAARVRADFLGGVRSGVNGTPTFFINGWRHDGPFDFDTLLEAIEDEIAAVAGRR
ncbi:MAG: bdbD [Gemmataceae bacterium]|nr:bdbD [Gemmataceae bacterium]